MIERQLAKQLTLRFSALPGYPRENESLTALVDAFQRAPRNEAHARRIADDLLVDVERCPRPAEVWKIASATDPAGFWQGNAEPPAGGIHTREEYLRDADVIALAKTFGVPVESLWPLAGDEPEAQPAAAATAPKLETATERQTRLARSRQQAKELTSIAATAEYREWMRRHEPAGKP
jgi:hypothetical protein